MNNNINEVNLKKEAFLYKSSFLLTMFSILINGFIKMFIGEYADPIAEMSIILFLPIAYTYIYLTVNYELFSKTEKYLKVSMIFSTLLAISLLALLVINFSDGLLCIQDGKLTNAFSLIPCFMWSIISFIASLNKFLKIKKYSSN